MLCTGRVDEFLAHWRSRARKRDPRFDLDEALRDAEPPGDAPLPAGYREGEEIPVALAWFPAGEYERAIERWADVAEDWAAAAHGEYCRRLDGHIKWMRSHAVPVRAVAPILVDEYTAWCAQRGQEPEDARAAYAADRFAAGAAIPWPPARNAPCWCGSHRKYKKCCAVAAARPMHDPADGEQQHETPTQARGGAGGPAGRRGATRTVSAGRLPANRARRTAAMLRQRTDPDGCGETTGM